MWQMARVLIVCGTVIGAGVHLSGPFANAANQDRDVTLTGCVVRGEDAGDGFLLTNVTGDSQARHAPGTTVAPGPIGTSGAATVLYWLEEDDELEAHVGHRVEVKGELEGDLKAGEIEIDREGAWTELTVRSEGRRLTARVPQSIFVTSPGARDDSVDVLVRKVDVERVRMIAASCDR
jgi:hypothetical protein